MALPVDGTELKPSATKLGVDQTVAKSKGHRNWLAGAGIPKTNVALLRSRAVIFQASFDHALRAQPSGASAGSVTPHFEQDRWSFINRMAFHDGFHSRQ
jgi:hypothetical protein